jgi:hypothetical protein
MSRAGRKTPGRGIAVRNEQRRLEPFSQPPNTRLRKVTWFGAVVVAIGVGFAAGRSLKRAETPPVSPTPAESVTPALPKSYYELLAMSPEELARIDIAVMNLLCVQGLPGAEKLDIPAALKKLDEWAAKVKSETQRHLYRVTDPRYTDHYAHSEARLRAEFIVQCLQEDCGVDYNMARVNDPDFRNSQDIFLHGMIGSANGGTCASMPVMYVAISRRLGYPMKLVAAEEHLFCRWDDGKEKFNIEGATNGGVSYHVDEYYRKWPHPLTDADMASGVFLTSKSPTDELADFLHHRGMCLDKNGRLVEAREAFAAAHRLQPKSANTFTALRVVCGLGRGVGYAAPSPAAQAWQRGPMMPDADDPTPRIPMPGFNPALATSNKPTGGPR